MTNTAVESRESINMNEHLLNEQMRMLETLRAADNDYRGILTAAASLTSSLRSIRIGQGRDMGSDRPRSVSPRLHC